MGTLQDDLSNLLEIQSLEMKIKSHLDIITEEKTRLTRVETFRSAKTKRQEELTQEINNLNEFISQNEKEIFSIENKLNKTKSHLSMVSNENELKALEQELKTLDPKLEELQDHGIAQLERLEDFETELAEIIEYLKGSIETLAMIQSEIDTVSQKENTEINNLNSRINLIKENISKDVLDNYHRLNEKYQYNRPVTFLTGNTCRECRFQVDQGMIQEIERYLSLCLCSGCGRILTINS